jgi:DNA-directed RNA polymerase specialized sigma24 family protein
MTTQIEIPPPPPSSPRRRSAPLDPAADRTTVRPMKAEEHLKNQDWKVIAKQLTSFAHRHTGKRSLENAQDLAQQAIVDALTRPDRWDPAKEPLMQHLCRRVWGLAANEWHRKRNSFEVAMRAALKSHGVSHDGGRKEIDGRSDEDPLDEALDRRRLAASYRARLNERLAGDEPVMVVTTLFLERVDAPGDQATASGLTPAQVADARRPLFYHADKVSKELASEIDSEDDRENEVTP